MTGLPRITPVEFVLAIFPYASVRLGRFGMIGFENPAAQALLEAVFSRMRLSFGYAEFLGRPLCWTLGGERAFAVRLDAAAFTPEAYVRALSMPVERFARVKEFLSFLLLASAPPFALLLAAETWALVHPDLAGPFAQLVLAASISLPGIILLAAGLAVRKTPEPSPESIEAVRAEVRRLLNEAKLDPAIFSKPAKQDTKDS